MKKNQTTKTSCGSDWAHLYKSARDGRARWSIIEKKRTKSEGYLSQKLPLQRIWHKCPKQAKYLRAGRNIGTNELERWVPTYVTYTSKYKCNSCGSYAPNRITAAYKLMMKL